MLLGEEGGKSQKQVRGKEREFGEEELGGRGGGLNRMDDGLKFQGVWRLLRGVSSLNLFSCDLGNTAFHDQKKEKKKCDRE